MTRFTVVGETFVTNPWTSRQLQDNVALLLMYAPDSFMLRVADCGAKARGPATDELQFEIAARRGEFLQLTSLPCCGRSRAPRGRRRRPRAPTAQPRRRERRWGRAHRLSGRGPAGL